MLYLHVRRVAGLVVCMHCCPAFADCAGIKVGRGAPTIAAEIITKNTFQNKCFGTINFAKITKQSLYKASPFACFLANRDKPVAATLQRKCSGGIIFVIITKIITKIVVPRNYFYTNFGQDGIVQEMRIGIALSTLEIAILTVFVRLRVRTPSSL